jgi:hypothetical protein
VWRRRRRAGVHVGAAGPRGDGGGHLVAHGRAAAVRALDAERHRRGRVGEAIDERSRRAVRALQHAVVGEAGAEGEVREGGGQEQQERGGRRERDHAERTSTEQRYEYGAEILARRGQKRRQRLRYCTFGPNTNSQLRGRCRFAAAGRGGQRLLATRQPYEGLVTLRPRFCGKIDALGQNPSQSGPKCQGGGIYNYVRGPSTCPRRCANSWRRPNRPWGGVGVPRGDLRPPKSIAPRMV